MFAIDHAYNWVFDDIPIEERAGLANVSDIITGNMSFLTKHPDAPTVLLKDSIA